MSKRNSVPPCVAITDQLREQLRQPANLDFMLADLSQRYPEGVLTFGWRDGQVFAFVQTLYGHNWRFGPPTCDGIRLDAVYPNFTEAAGWLMLKIEAQEGK